MKKIIRIIFIILIVILVKLFYSYSINEKIIDNYDKKDYSETLIYSLYFLNFNEPYIVYYNHGNLLYQQGNYEDAILKYQKALDKKPSKKRVCDVRVNLALSMAATINVKDKDNALEKLKEAKEVLYEDDCAHEEDRQGKSAEAESLEEELKKKEKELNKEEKEDKDDSDDQQEEEDNSNNEKNIEEKIKEGQKQAAESRKEETDFSENRTINYEGKTW